MQYRTKEIFLDAKDTTEMLQTVKDTVRRQQMHSFEQVGYYKGLKIRLRAKKIQFVQQVGCNTGLKIHLRAKRYNIYSK